MKKMKRYAIAAFCCVSFCVKPALAFWPVLDFGEIIPVVKNVTTTMNTVSEAKSQLTEMKNTLTAIGDKIGGLSSFFPGLDSMLDGIKDTVSGTVGKVTSGLNAASNLQDKVSGAIGKTNGAQGGLVSGLVDNVNKNIKDLDSQTVNKPVTPSLPRQPSLRSNPLLPKSFRQLETLPVEEEEEEEEVQEEQSVSPLKQEIKVSFDVVKAENKQLAVQLNDVLDMSLATMNKIAESIRKSLDEFELSLTETQELDSTTKESLKTQLAQIQQKSTALTDRMAAVMEAAKERYNAEYQAKINDGINNYEKTVEMYLNGDISEDIVKKAGEQLKKDVAAIDTVPDKLILDELNSQSEKIKEELAQLSDKIHKLTEKIENNVEN